MMVGFGQTHAPGHLADLSNTFAMSLFYRAPSAAWNQTHAGLPLVDPSSGTETQRVHCFAPRWALHADGYTPVVFERPLVT